MLLGVEEGGGGEGGGGGRGWGTTERRLGDVLRWGEGGGVAPFVIPV